MRSVRRRFVLDVTGSAVLLKPRFIVCKEERRKPPADLMHEIYDSSSMTSVVLVVVCVVMCFWLFADG